MNISKQGARYVAHAPALDISTAGRTKSEVKKRFAQLVPLFFEELQMAGTTADVLTELVWQKSTSGRTPVKGWSPPRVKSEQMSVRIPWLRSHVCREKSDRCTGRNSKRFSFMSGANLSAKKGDHRVYWKEGVRRSIIIPRDTGLPPGIVLNNLRTLGISREDYLDFLNRN